jgi:hypothetical protein
MIMRREILHARGEAHSQAQAVIEELLLRAGDPAAELDLRRLVAQHVGVLNATRRPDDGGLVARAEAMVRADPLGAFALDPSGIATLMLDERCWCAGRFETRSIGELRAWSSGDRGGTPRLWVFVGDGPATDIGGLQATIGGSPLFQVASQFNCLESPGPWIVPVARYFADPTQGPRAAISAFPAALQRHYAAPGLNGDRFLQTTDQEQIDLLADVFPPGRSPVRNGYLAGDGGLGGGGLGGDAVATALDDQFDAIRVGVHDQAEIALGYDWYGTVQDADHYRIAQCFTSTVAAPYGGRSAFGANFERVCQQLLRAAYLGTLLAAIALDRSPVVLTLVGGGAFGNPLELIWESIIWAFDRVPLPAAGRLDVIVNGRNLRYGHQIETLLLDVRRRGGVVFRFDSGGLTRIDR